MKPSLKKLAYLIKEMAQEQIYGYQTDTVDFYYTTPCGAEIGVQANCNLIHGNFRNGWEYSQNRIESLSINISMILNENSIEMPNVTNHLNQLLN